MWRPLIVVLALASALPPASAGGLEDAFRRFIDRIRAEGRQLPDVARALGTAIEAPKPQLDKRVDELPLGQNGIVVVVAPGCRQCERAVAYLRGKKLDFTVLDITRSDTARESYALMKGQGLPTVLVRDQRLTGWDETLFKRAAMADTMRQAGQIGD